MSLVKKILLSLIWSIFFITIVNILAFYFFFSEYLTSYLEETKNKRESVTIEYINHIMEKQALEEVDTIFNDIELQFFELLENNNWKIPLNSDENVNIILNYLVKSWVAPKYIEEIIPENNIEKVITSLKDKNSQEYVFLTKFTNSILLTNFIAISILIILFLILSKIIILPIKSTAEKIKDLKIWKDFKIINYNKKDEIWLLVNALNELNRKLSIWENIRNRLLADISHELKTPITSIQCYLEWIKDWVIKLDEKTLNSILTEMQRLIKLVNKIMAYEKFETSDLRMNILEEDVRFITEKIIHQFRLKLRENNQRVITSWLNKKIRTDKDSFIQIVQNIISNFIKYAWRNTTLKIEFWVNFIKFQDNWKWISKNELPYIKEKFYQWKNERSWDIEERWIWIWFSVIEKIIDKLDWEMEITSEENAWFEIKIYTKSPH